MYQQYCRTYQMIMRTFTTFLKWRKPQLIEGVGSINNVPSYIINQKINHLFIVTDKGIVSSGLMEPLLIQLDKTNIRYDVFSDTKPNPTIDLIEEALQQYKELHCDALLAFGGGSPIDCAKVIAARVAQPNKKISELKGVMKVQKETPLLIAVPTTAGTGSEATLAAVVSDAKTFEKYALMDPVLTPDIAVLDPNLTIKLPKNLTAATGMDALTHAIEAYIGKSTTSETEQQCLEAVKLLLENLYEAYENGENIKAREKVQKASYLAGLAFSRAYVGNVHAIAHTLGGFYSTPHGLANAIILPYVLEAYGEKVYPRLANLADAVNLVESTTPIADKAVAFIEAVKNLNDKMGIPNKTKVEDKDIPLMVNRAYTEANPLYPVPQIFNKSQFAQLYQQIRES
ncbi:iron-containing alcohol dehydrogenase [Alkalihalobacillus sp. 1P02AB]|uniref:iron-containing alcohol dehydrogenase n=1 Tax=Alkalihalobacillus sp. 1P02AB TaxID=3132260 RepID=UPI0039A4AED1